MKFIDLERGAYATEFCYQVQMIFVYFVNGKKSLFVPLISIVPRFQSEMCNIE